MDEAEAKVAAVQLLAELRGAMVTREDSDRLITGLRKLVEGYIELYPVLETLVEPGDFDDDDDFGGPSRPRGMDAALAVLRANPGKWYPVSSVVELLESRGWSPRSSNPRNAVRAALERLVENKQVERNKDRNSGAVIYRVPPVVPPKAPPARGGEYGFDEEPF